MNETPNPAVEERPFHIHWGRWIVAALVSGVGYAAVLLPLQAIEILHFRVYEAVHDYPDPFFAVSLTVASMAALVGLGMAIVGIGREALLHRMPRPWRWWTPLAGVVPAALASHVFERVSLGVFALLVHLVVAGSTRERRWLRGGALVTLILALPFTDAVRHAYAERVIRFFYFQRLRYITIGIWARKGGHVAGEEETKLYLPSIEELPVGEGELFWLGIVSLTKDPWGHPYHFARSRRVSEGYPHPDYGAWTVDYTYASYGADGLRGGTGYNADIFPENVVPAEEIPFLRTRPMEPPESLYPPWGTRPLPTGEELARLRSRFAPNNETAAPGEPKPVPFVDGKRQQGDEDDVKDGKDQLPDASPITEAPDAPRQNDMNREQKKTQH